MWGPYFKQLEKDFSVDVIDTSTESGYNVLMITGGSISHNRDYAFSLRRAHKRCGGDLLTVQLPSINTHYVFQEGSLVQVRIGPEEYWNPLRSDSAQTAHMFASIVHTEVMQDLTKRHKGLLEKMTITIPEELTEAERLFFLS